jgi:anti-sigma factor RsiW
LEQIANDDQLIAQYLLGTLSEEEADRLDEMSIADDTFAARLQTVENDLVDAYVSGELSGQLLESFQSHYLASPKRREKVAIAQELQGFIGRTLINRQAEEPQPDASAGYVTDKPVSRKGFLRRYFFMPGLAIRWGVAAAALLVILAGGWLMVENLRLRNQIHQAQVERDELQRREQELQTQLREQSLSDSQTEEELANLRQQLASLEQQLAQQQGAKSQPPVSATEPNIFAFALAPQTRSVGQIATISIPADADYVTLQLELEAADFTSYRAELRAQPGGAVVWRSASLKARARDDGRAIAVTIRPALLKSQRYTIEVQGFSSPGTSEIIGSYAFRVVK